MEQYLRAFSNYVQDIWVELLPLAEFAYHNGLHMYMWITPFWANYLYHLVLQFKALKQQSSLKSEIQAETFAAGLNETQQNLQESSQEAHSNQTKYGSGHRLFSRFQIRSGFQ
jgi:hypothetical protein